MAKICFLSLLAINVLVVEAQQTMTIVKGGESLSDSFYNLEEQYTTFKAVMRSQHYCLHL
jgi:hypothetical protein